MIFDISVEESTQLGLLDMLLIDKMQKYEDVCKKYGNDSKQAEDAKKVFIKESSALEKEFSEFWEQYELERFNKLGTPEEILEDARSQAAQAIPYVYMRIWEYAADKDKKTKDIVDISGGGLYVHLNNWDYSYLHTTFMQEVGEDPETNSNFLLDATGLQTYITRDILGRHFAALRGLPEEEELRNDLSQIIAASPYAIIKPLKENVVTVDIQRLIRTPLADIATYGLMNDKINAQLIQGEMFAQETNGQLVLKFATDQAPKQQKQVPVFMALTYEGTEGKLTKRLTSFDNSVYNALATRFYYWRMENPGSPLYITPQEIWRTRNGKKIGDGNAKPSKAQVQRICESIDKMRFTRFYMDITEEIKAHNLYIDDERVTAGKIDTYVLNCSKVEFETEKGNRLQGYMISDEPILYTYNKAKKRIIEVPYEMLDTSSNTSDSENVAEFRDYLLLQVQLMKNAEDDKDGKRFKRSRIILLDTIYKSTGILPPEERVNHKDFKTENSRQTVIRRLRKTDREKIEGILDAWKAKGWIQGYVILNQKNEPLREKQQAKGYEIQL